MYSDLEGRRKKKTFFYAFPITHHDIKRARAPCRAFHRGASECSQMQCVNQARASFGPQFWQKIVERRHLYSYLIRLTVLLELFRTTKLALQWIKSNFNLCLLCSGLILPPSPLSHTLVWIQNKCLLELRDLSPNIISMVIQLAVKSYFKLQLTCREVCLPTPPDDWLTHWLTATLEFQSTEQMTVDE